MGNLDGPQASAGPPARTSARSSLRKPLISVAVIVTGWIAYTSWAPKSINVTDGGLVRTDTIVASPYGQFPVPGDPFSFIPCTSASVLPALEAADPTAAWAQLFDPNPAHWSWSEPVANATLGHDQDDYSGRGIFLCGYLDVPLDYTNASDARIARLAVTKLQVSGLAPLAGPSGARRSTSAGEKSERTIVIEPGGPGGSGTRYAWSSAGNVSRRLSDGRFDVLGWDPRGVNASLPAVSCFPHDADRDRWSGQLRQFREVSPSPRRQLEYVDAMHQAVLRACWERQGDLARFLGTSFVARDMEEIRKALGEDELTGYLVSYGTGIGQIYANMFPDSVGRMILDGTEYTRDNRELAGFGLSGLDNGTHAWHDGFLGECVNAGPEHCALARQNGEVTLASLEARMDALLKGLVERPIPGYTEKSGPSLITYSNLVGALYSAMYNAGSWSALAQMLYELEGGNSTLAAAFLDQWTYDPSLPCPSTSKPLWSELTVLVICADSYDAPQPVGLDWWVDLWEDMTTQSWIAGNSNFFYTIPCRHFAEFWPEPAEAYRGDLNHTLKHPVLLIAETYDPATPLRNARRLLGEMGQNARLIVHHGYGHSSRDTSSCTDSVAKAFILDGVVPEDSETDCYADGKPYLYDVKAKGELSSSVAGLSEEAWDPVADWRKHMTEVDIWH